MLSRRKEPREDYALRVRKLRATLALTQHAFAELLQVRPQVVASWEQSRREPSAKSYQQLARLAPVHQARFFLSKMGMTPDLTRKLVPDTGFPALEIRICTTEDWKKTASEGLRVQIQIPVLRDEAAGRSPLEIGWRDIDCFIAVPPRAVPKGPGAYTGIYIRGDSMEPILRERFAVVVDHTRTDAAELRGRLVAVRLPDGVQVKLLARESQPDRLVLRSYNSEYPDIILRSFEKGPILGDVVFWWGSQENRD